MRPMSRRMSVGAVLVAALTLAGCSSAQVEPDTAPAPTPSPSISAARATEECRPPATASFEPSDGTGSRLIEEIKGRLQAEGANVSDIDGVRVQTSDGWWLLRASNTQDVLVARCEAGDEAGLERLKSTVVSQLEQSGIEPPQF